MNEEGREADILHFLGKAQDVVVGNTQGCRNLDMYQVDILNNMGCCANTSHHGHSLLLPSGDSQAASKNNPDSRCELRPSVRNHLPLSVVPIAVAGEPYYHYQINTTYIGAMSSVPTMAQVEQ